jgi:hypothetical protein
MTNSIEYKSCGDEIRDEEESLELDNLKESMNCFQK